MRLRIQAKIVAPYLVLFLAAAAAIAWTAVRSVETEVRGEIRDGMERLLEQMTSGTFPLNDRVAGHLEGIWGFEIVLCDAEGIPSVSTLPAERAAVLGRRLREGLPAASPGGAPTVRLDGVDFMFVAGPRRRPVGGGSDTLALLYPLARLREQQAPAIRRILLLSAGSVGAVTLLGLVIGGWLLRPLRRLLSTARAVEAGDLTERARISSGDEFESLGRAFDTMLDALQQHEETRVRSEKEDLFRRIAINVAHEIRNPLSSIRMNAQQLAGPSGDGKEVLADLLAEIDRLELIVEELFGLARTPELRKGPTGLNDVVLRVLDLWRRQIEHVGVTLETDLATDLPAVEADAGRIQQVIINLLVNAQQAIGSDGRIRIVTRRSGDGVRLEIRDTGPGVPADSAARIFEPFHTTKEHGTGLGLPLCREIVEAHRGRIGWTRDDGETVFFVELTGT